MSASDDILSFEEQLQRLINDAVEAVERRTLYSPPTFVLGYLMGGAGFTAEQRAALHDRIVGAAAPPYRTVEHMNAIACGEEGPR